MKVKASVIAISVLGAFCAAGANAACSNFQQKDPAATWQNGQSVQGHGRFLSTAFMPVYDADGDGAAIVGMWKFEFTAQGNTGPGAPPDGAPIDAGYVTWHADGTELMNSGRPPISGDFCMGVWKQVAPATFKLNHIAMAWDPTGTVYVGPANIREMITVNSTGNRYWGTFTLVQYATDEKTVLGSVKGTVSATRVTVN